MKVEEVARFIKYERRKRGMSMRELSDKCGVRPATICDIENGRVKGQIETISDILCGLGYELDVRSKI